MDRFYSKPFSRILRDHLSAKRWLGSEKCFFIYVDVGWWGGPKHLHRAAFETKLFHSFFRWFKCSKKFTEVNTKCETLQATLMMVREWIKGRGAINEFCCKQNIIHEKYGHSGLYVFHLKCVVLTKKHWKKSKFWPSDWYWTEKAMPKIKKSYHVHIFFNLCGLRPFD